MAKKIIPPRIRPPRSRAKAEARERKGLPFTEIPSKAEIAAKAKTEIEAMFDEEFKKKYQYKTIREISANKTDLTNIASKMSRIIAKLQTELKESKIKPREKEVNTLSQYWERVAKRGTILSDGFFGVGGWKEYNDKLFGDYVKNLIIIKTEIDHWYFKYTAYPK
jgi:hypothetical protein